MAVFIKSFSSLLAMLSLIVPVAATAKLLLLDQQKPKKETELVFEDLQVLVHEEEIRPTLQQKEISKPVTNPIVSSSGTKGSSSKGQQGSGGGVERLDTGSGDIEESDPSGSTDQDTNGEVLDSSVKEPEQTTTPTPSTEDPSDSKDTKEEEGQEQQDSEDEDEEDSKPKSLNEDVSSSDELQKQIEMPETGETESEESSKEGKKLESLILNDFVTSSASEILKEILNPSN